MANTQDKIIPILIIIITKKKYHWRLILLKELDTQKNIVPCSNGVIIAELVIDVGVRL